MADAPPKPLVIGRRLKAALALVDRTAEGLHAAVGADLGISLGTLQRIMQEARAAKPVEIRVFAEELGVPEWFLRDGFAGAPSERNETAESIDARLELALVELVDRLEEQLVDRLAESVSDRVARSLERERPEAGREDRPHAPSRDVGPAGLR